MFLFQWSFMGTAHPYLTKKIPLDILFQTHLTVNKKEEGDYGPPLLDNVSYVLF